MTEISVGVQLYSVREDCARDLPGTLAAISKIGYTGVEFAGYYDRSAQELRKLLDDHGLRCCGTHARLDTLLGDALKKTIEFNQALGNPYLIVPALPEERRNSIDAWRSTGFLFSELAEKVRPYQMRVGYHNHAVEFKPLHGQIPFDIFFQAAGKEVIMQLDLGNAAHGGANPIEYLKRYASQAVTVHLKEYSAVNPKAWIGQGEISWQEVFEVCETNEVTTWYIVEQESYAVPPLEAIAKCREALRRMGK